MISEYKEYLSPIKVYIPLTDTEYKIANVHVEIGDKVLEGQKLADKFSGKLKRAVISSVSGTVAAFVRVQKVRSFFPEAPRLLRQD